MAPAQDTADPLARVYAERAADYEVLVSHEDYRGNLPRALRRIRSAEGLDVVDLGAGTGRLACMLAPVARSVSAFDVSAHMLTIAIQKLGSAETRQWQTAVADHRAIPLPNASADLVLSGWSLVYAVLWHQENWQHELQRALDETRRVLRPGGTVVVIETLGTGHTTPTPPPNLKPYLAYLEEAGFLSTWIRTDYEFASTEEAQRIAGFFFGEEIVARTTGAGPVVLPECTGIWWCSV